MGFSSLLGQPTVVQTLERALTARQVHHAYRFEGPDGVGKELAALRLAQALVCEKGDPFGCETCSACHRAITFATETPEVPLHPDVLLVQRGLYPPSVLGSTSSEATGIGVDQIRRIVLGRVGFPPHEGKALVIIIRAAEELTVSAANALLKTLEEPSSRNRTRVSDAEPRTPEHAPAFAAAHSDHDHKPNHGAPPVPRNGDSITRAQQEIAETRDRMSETAAAIEARVSGAAENVKDGLDPARFVSEHPWPALAAAIVAGVVLSATRADEKVADKAVDAATADRFTALVQAGLPSEMVGLSAPLLPFPTVRAAEVPA